MAFRVQLLQAQALLLPMSDGATPHMTGLCTARRGGRLLLGMSSDKPALGTAPCTRMQWLPHQAGDVGELHAGALQPCAPSWTELLHKGGCLSAATVPSGWWALSTKREAGHEV